MVKWKMERREERNGITRWWKLWERGNGETKKPRKRKIGRRGNGDRENGKMEKSRSGMDSWRNGKFLLWMNGWDEQPNYWLRTTGRKQRLEGRGDGMVMTSDHSLPYPPFPPTPPPPKKKETRDRRSGNRLHLQSIWRIQVSFCIFSMRRRKRRESCSQVTEPSDSFLFGYLIHWTKARREMKQLKVNIYHKYLLNQFLPFIFFL